MKKLVPIVILVILATAALVASSIKTADALDVATQQMIQQDHIMVGLLVNYIAEMQQRGVLPKQEENK